MSQLSFIVFSTDPKIRMAISAQLEDTRLATVLARVAELPALQEELRSGHADAAYVDLGTDPQAVLQALESAPAPRPPLLLGGPGMNPELMKRAMRLGARAYFAGNETGDELFEAVERLFYDIPKDELAPTAAATLAVIGTKGGVGATQVACQLAARLASMGSSVALVDLHRPFGDVALHLDLKPLHTIADIAQKDVELDATSVGACLMDHSSGVSVLAAAASPEEASLVEPHHVQHTLGLLQEQFNWVVIDLPRDLDRAGWLAIDRSNQVLLVTGLDVPSLTHTRRMLEALRSYGVPEESIRVVANRTEREGEVPEKDLMEFLGKPLNARIPSDPRTAAACINEGVSAFSYDARSPLARAIDELAVRAHTWCKLDLPFREERKKPLVKRIRTYFGKSKHGTY